MDREQRRSSIALIPLSEFEGIDRSPDTVVQEPTLAYTEKCAYWINVSLSLNFTVLFCLKYCIFI